jgi:hypothetical protein
VQAFTPFVQVTTYATRHFATLGLAPAAANHFFSQCHLPGISHPFCAIAIGAYLMMRCIALVYAVVNWRVIHMVPV